MAEIFLMEDDHGLRRILTEYLRGAGHNVTSFEDGTASADTDILAGADVLITDLSMPRTDGYEAVLLAQAQRPALPIIVISGSENTPSGMVIFGFLRKPFPEDQLLGMVNRALASIT